MKPQLFQEKEICFVFTYVIKPKDQGITEI
jgi:hypothetical protein